MIEKLNKYSTLLLLAILILSMYEAFRVPRLVDDAFISFRYAENLINGNGLIWNLGDAPVEGYSNFLWTVLIAIAMKIGVHPEQAVFFLSFPIHLLALLLIWKVARLTLKNDLGAIFVLAAAGLNHSLYGFATSGLETSLQLLTFMAVWYLLITGMQSGWTIRRTILLSLLLALSIFNRPDSGLLIAFAGWIWFATIRERSPHHLPALIFPFALLVAPWLVWKFAFYGSLLPNSFHAKVRGVSGVGYGLYYVYLFIMHYMLAPYLLIIAANFLRIRRDSPAIGYMIIFTAAWFVYVILSGGDFMEFRFFVPVLPLLLIAIVASLGAAFTNRATRIALCLVFLLATINNARDIENVFFAKGVEKLESLTGHIYAHGENWIAIGKQLHKLFDGTDVSICAGAAGAIPYYSKLYTVDFLGLNDKDIPPIAEHFSEVAGHRIIAPLDYIHERGVNLIVQPIRLMFPNDQFEHFARQARWTDAYGFFFDLDKPVDGQLLREITLLGIPLEHGYTLVVWYLNPHPKVDEIIRTYGLRTIILRR
ncbi:hypothetical protein ACFLQV_05005 [Calditrichota bacterium]